jgi:methionine biosynthesis protein MetW
MNRPLDKSLSAIIERLENQRISTPAEVRERWQDNVILNQIPKGSYVLDLGCGQGELLAQLIREREVSGQGVEVDPQAAMVAMDLGVPVLNVDLDEVLGDFTDQSFDYVILQNSLQTLKAPLKVLYEMLRVGRRGIVSFPNFGHWRVRLDLAARGRMPVTPGLPYRWHDTPNIHFFTLAEFMDFCQANNLMAGPSFALAEGRIRELGPDDNLIAEEVMVFLENGQS